MSGEDRADEGKDWQRLDKWLWCARFMRQRADCARLVTAGGLRINRQPTDKPHAKLRVGDVLTVALGRDVRVVVVRSLAVRRGPAEDARALYSEIAETQAIRAEPGGGGCDAEVSAAYRPSTPQAGRPDTRSA